jgi:hypothetical protein
VTRRLFQRGVSEADEARCLVPYERDMAMWQALAVPMGGARGLALCNKPAFVDDHQSRGILMATHPPYSVVLTYDEDEQRFHVQTADPAKLAALLASRLNMPILLDEFEYKIDDEFARRLGVAMLNLIALGKPDLKRYMNVTPGPISKDGEDDQ